MPVVKKLIFNHYKRHKPEQDLFYKTVMTYWPQFLEEQRKVNLQVPLFIQHEFENYLTCGIPENGFVRTYCYTCRLTGIVAFSCKQRGFCPSCCARRMNDEASHLVDHVLPPEVQFRQWVLSFPYKLRYAMAYDAELTNAVLSIFIKVISKYYKKKFKIFIDKKSQLKKLKTGSVTFIQRFGSALNLNVHFHTLFSDGVFEKEVITESQRKFHLDSSDSAHSFSEMTFQVINDPTKEELICLTEQIKTKVKKLMDNKLKDESDQMSFDEELQNFNTLTKASMTHQSLYGSRSGQGVRRLGDPHLNGEDELNQKEDRYTYSSEGFSLNARVVIKPGEKKKLEKLLRYMGRGPVATKRLTEYYPNGLLYELKTPWKDGTTHMNFTPLDFIARLVALIPPANMNMIRYHGVFAPNSKDRKLVVPGYDENEENAIDHDQHSLKNPTINKDEGLSLDNKLDLDFTAHDESVQAIKTIVTQVENTNLNKQENLSSVVNTQLETEKFSTQIGHNNQTSSRFIEIVSTSKVKNIFQDEKVKRHIKRERMRWADMLKRTFEIDVTTCLICGGRIEQIAVIKDKSVAKAILKSLYETSVLQPVKLDEDRGPPSDSVRLFSDYFDGSMISGFDEEIFNQSPKMNEFSEHRKSEETNLETAINQNEYSQMGDWLDE